MKASTRTGLRILRKITSILTGIIFFTFIAIVAGWFLVPMSSYEITPLSSSEKVERQGAICPCEGDDIFVKLSKSYIVMLNKKEILMSGDNKLTPVDNFSMSFTNTNQPSAVIISTKCRITAKPITNNIANYYYKIVLKTSPFYHFGSYIKQTQANVELPLKYKKSTIIKTVQ